MTVNRNSIPFDTNRPWLTSGIRMGTPATTSLGMKEKEMQMIANFLVNTLKNTKPKIKNDNTPSKADVIVDEKICKEIHKEIDSLLNSFPLYPEIVVD